MQNINTVPDRQQCFLFEVEHEAERIARNDKNFGKHRMRGAFAYKPGPGCAHGARLAH